ncbi:MAG: hypothetical protein QOE92_1384 [Chloroflexota bacterium]|jgi:4-hydroxybenzoate polyprenyltransferase|nr:hypothetical protein [Chloroflexota bacterium]
MRGGGGTIGGLVRACHPEPTAAVTALTSLLALTSGRGWGTAWVALAVLSGQLSVGWANDYLDHERDRAAGRTDKPIPGGRVSPELVRYAAVVALLVAVPLSLLSGPRAAAVHLFALALAHLYNLVLKGTIVSVLPYALAFGVLPAFVTLGQGDNPHVPAPWIMAGAGLLGAAAHFTQVLPDLATDAAVGIRGLPQRLGAGGSLVAAAVMLLGGSLIAALGPGRVPDQMALLALGATWATIAAIIVAGIRRRYGAAFHLTIAAAAGALATFVLSGRGFL